MIIQNLLIRHKTQKKTFTIKKTIPFDLDQMAQ